MIIYVICGIISLFTCFVFCCIYYILYKKNKEINEVNVSNCANQNVNCDDNNCGIVTNKGKDSECLDKAISNIVIIDDDFMEDMYGENKQDKEGGFNKVNDEQNIVQIEGKTIGM